MMCGGVAFRYCNVLDPIVLTGMLSHPTLSHAMPLAEAAAREAEEACFIVFVLCQVQASRLVECVCCELVCWLVRLLPCLLQDSILLMLLVSCDSILVVCEFVGFGSTLHAILFFSLACCL